MLSASGYYKLAKPYVTMLTKVIKGTRDTERKMWLRWMYDSGIFDLMNDHDQQHFLLHTRLSK